VNTTFNTSTPEDKNRKRVSETSGINSILPWLIAQEDFIQRVNFSRSGG
jgi:hypothetical protein